VSKARGELKGALKGLNLAEPTRIPRIPKALSFKAPGDAFATSVVLSTQVSRPTQGGGTTEVNETSPVAAPTQVLAETPVELTTEVPFVTQVNCATEDATPTSDELATGVVDPSPVTDSPSVDLKAQVPISTQVEKSSQGEESPNPQSQAVQLMREVSPKLSNGYTRVPNRLLMEIVSGELNRTEIKIVLLVARLTISYQRRYVPLSKTSLERYLGTQGNTVLQALSRLVQTGVLLKITGNQRSPNQFALANKFDLGPSGGNPSSVEFPPGVDSTQGTSVVSATQTPVGNPSPFKDITYPATHLPEVTCE